MTSEIVQNCRLCNQPDPRTVLAFGRTPLADRLLKPEDVSAPEPHAGLTLVFCPECALLQLRETVAPEILYGTHYRYYSSSIPSLVEHARANVEELCRRYRLNSNSLVIEVASNDGYLLQHFLPGRIPVLGIDPCPGAVDLARQKRVPTLHGFFDGALACKLSKDGRTGDLIIANNVLAHVPNPNDFVAGLRALLKPGGVAVLEVHYVVPLVERNEFDTVYHQHICYFSLTSLSALFRRHQLFINDVRQLSIYGGSLRFHVGREESPTPAVAELLAEEQRRGLGRLEYYSGLAAQAERTRTRLRELLDTIKQQGKRIAGYGAPAKATTLMAYCGIDSSDIEYIVDINPHKHGMVMCGTHIPVCSTQRLLDAPPEYLLLFSWNFLDEIVAQQRAFIDRGGKFIVPIPVPGIIP